MSVTRMTLPPRWSGGVRRMMPSGTGSAAPLFDAGAESVVHRPARTGEPGATSAVGSSGSETMQERPAAFTPVTIRRTLPGLSFSYVVGGRLCRRASHRVGAPHGHAAARQPGRPWGQYLD